MSLSNDASPNDSWGALAASCLGMRCGGRRGVTLFSRLRNARGRRRGSKTLSRDRLNCSEAPSEAISGQYPCLIRTIVLYGVTVASLLACSTMELTERSMPRPTAAPVVTQPPDLAPTSELAPDPTATPTPTTKTVGLLLNEPAAFSGYTLFNKRGHKTIYLIDNQGRVVHRWELDAKTLFARLLENGNLLTVSLHDSGDSGVSGRYVTEVDRNGDTLWKCPQVPMHHDVLKMPNGNMLLLSQQGKTAEEAIAAGANPDFIGADGLLAPHIIEVKPTGPTNCEIVWEWSTWDHLIQDFDSSKANYGVVAEHPELIDLNFRLSEVASWEDPADWIHSNGIDYDPELDQIVLSPRHFSEVWIIDHSTTTAEAAGHSGGKGGKGGDLLYRWGNPRAWRAGTPADQQLFWPHNPQWIAPGLPGAGNILIFNNGDEFADFRRGYSSVDEIAPPVDGANYRLDSDLAYASVEPVWVYTAATPSDFYAAYISGAQRLPNGNTLICDGVHGTLFEVTPAGKTVWKYVNPMTGNGPLHQGESVPIIEEMLANQVYRAYRYAPDYPGLQGLDLTPGEPIELPGIMSVSAYLTRLVGDRQPAIRADWDVYLVKNSLVYVKEQCTPEDVEPTFFLHLYPVDLNDLPSHRQQYGFDNLDFAFKDHRLFMKEGVCVARRELPDYGIAALRTGQYTGESRIWEGSFDIPL